MLVALYWSHFFPHSFSFLTICLLLIFFRLKCREMGKCPQTHSTDPVQIILSFLLQNMNTTCVYALAWLLQLHANRRTRCATHITALSLSYSNTFTHSITACETLIALEKYLSVVYLMQKKDFVQCCINLWYIVANMLQVCMIYMSSVYLVCMGSQWEKRLHTASAMPKRWLQILFTL